MGSSKSAYPAGWHDRPGPTPGPGLPSDGTNYLMPGQSPTPSGLAIRPERGAMVTGRSALHIELLQEAARHAGEAVNPFMAAETFRYYILDRNIIGSVRKSTEHKEFIHKYKAHYVHALRDPIKAASARFQLPPVLLAGTVYNEVGGSDMIKPYVEVLRRMILGQAEADRTSIGPTSLQPRRALAALGYDPSKVDPTLRMDVVSSLIHNPPFAIFVCAKHLSDLRNQFLPGNGAAELGADDLIYLGSRYNHGPDAPDEVVRKDLSYGRTIMGRKQVLSRLLSDVPVSEPD